MAKTATLNVRIEPEVKAAAVKIFDEWGLSTSSAINMILKSIVRNEDVRPDVFLLHCDGLVDITNMTEQEIVDTTHRGYRFAIGWRYISCNWADPSASGEQGHAGTGRP